MLLEPFKYKYHPGSYYNAFDHRVSLLDLPVGPVHVPAVLVAGIVLPSTQLTVLSTGASITFVFGAGARNE